MVAIKDVEMPKDCMECMFCNHIKSNDYGTYGDCAILGDKERMNLLLHQKHSDCPLIDIEERKVGKWIKYNTAEKFDMFGDRVKVSSYKCSECGRIISDISEDGFTNKLQDYPYCHCGAEMKGEKNV